jgi:threonine dehydrogenase-like Zn-dependent dehydrogenase
VTNFGASHPSRLIGGCAEYHYFPPGGSLIRVPDAVSPALAASAACALRTVMHAFDQLGPIGSHESMLILGAGPLGLYSLAVAKDRGVKAALIIGAPQARLDVAREWGADHRLNLDESANIEDRLAWVRDHTSGRGADIVFNCANSQALGEGLRMVRPGGRLVQIGVSGGAPLSVSPMLFFRGVAIHSTIMAEARHFYQAIDFIATRGKQISFDRLISNAYRLDQTTEALQAMAELREVKPLILPRRAAEQQAA